MQPREFLDKPLRLALLAAEPVPLNHSICTTQVATPRLDKPKCFVAGASNFFRCPPDLTRVNDPEDRFDVILGPPAPSEEFRHAFEQFLTRASHPAAPLITRPGLGPRADVEINDFGEGSLRYAFQQLQPLLDRLRRLPPIEPGADRAALYVLALAETREQAITAHRAPHIAQTIEYPLLFGVPNPRSVLEGLAEAGLLKRQFFDRLFICRQCNSSRLLVREVCGSCRSSDISELSLVHHYSCGHQAPEPHFIPGEGYQCPKCRKQLRHYGVDYDKPGRVTNCNTCSSTMAEPTAWFVCLDCHAEDACEDCAMQTWHHYEITSDGIAAVRSGSLFAEAQSESASQSRSLRDFKLLVRHQIALARIHGRPISAFRIRLDLDAVEEDFGSRHTNDLRMFIKELAVQSLSKSDIVSHYEEGIIACLPETNRSAAEQKSEAIRTALTKTLRPNLNLHIELLELSAMADLVTGYKQ